MTKEEVKASLLNIISEIVPDEDVMNLEGNTSIIWNSSITWAIRS